MREQKDCSKGVIKAGIPTCQCVEEDNVWLGNLVEQVACVFHGGPCWVGSAEIYELCEDFGVIVEVGLDGVGLDLLELSEGGAFGYERKEMKG